MSKRRHDLDIYGATLHVAFTLNHWAKIKRRFDELPEQPESLGRTDLVFVVRDSGVSIPHLIVWVDLAAHEDDANVLVRTIAHEATHAAAMLLDHIGESYDGESEALACLVGWIVTQVWRDVQADGS